MRRSSTPKVAASAAALLTIALFIGPTATTALAAPPAQKLAFTTAAQVLTAGVTSNTITVQLQANNGSPVNASSNVTVTLSKTSLGGLFRNTADTATITSVTITSGTSSASFKYKDTRAGTATITASASGLTSATQNETVNAAALDHITVAPKTATIGIGASQSFTTTGSDQFANSLGDVTSSTTFTIAPDGSCIGATCSATATGAHTVTANDAGHTDTASLTVSASAASKLAITTAPQSLTAGVTSNTITAQLQTSAGAPVNASSAIIVNLSTNSTGGLFRNTADTATITSVTIASGTNSASFKYRDSRSGAATITTSTTNLLSGTQSETVNPAALDHIAVSPKTSTVASGASQTYAVTAFDVFNNSRGNVTGSTTFAISPNGSCNNATASCTATLAGAHTVTATFTGKTDTATLTVVAVATKLAFTTGPQTLTAGVTSGTVTVQMQDATGAAVNASSDVVVSLSTGSSGGVFRNTADTATIATVTITTGSNSASFRYKDTSAGSSTITASATGLTSAAQSETVNAAALDHIVIAPKTATVTAGVGQAYTAAAFDQFNNSLGSVTGSTTFTISPNGSCTGSTCQATAPGTHTVTGTNAGKSDTATLTVSAGGPASITISPTSSSVQAGVLQTYTVNATDQFGNPLGDVTAQTTFSISPSGTCTANQCTATITGSYQVTATDGTATAHASLTIKAAGLDHIVISPADATIPSGGSQSYTSEGFDVYGNSRGDLTSGTTFSITPNGSCTANVCSASISGSHTVRGVRGSKSATAILHVSLGGTAWITISPSASTAVAGVGVTYTAEAFDSSGNSLGDVTADTTFSISPDGSCSANSCSSTVAGAHTVTGTDGSFTDDATLTVDPAALDHIIVTPQDSTITFGQSQTFASTGYDVYGNSRGDLTSGTTFSITPDGSCTANVCTPASPGDHSVRGLRGGKESFAALHVTGTGTLASITISPSTATVVAGTSQNYTATGFDQFGNSLGDVTADTTFSISPDGSCSANSCSSTVAGAHTVTGTDGSFTDDATLTVDPAALDHIIVTPQDSTITFGQSQTFASTGYDVYGNSRGDLTSGTTFSITPDGSCTANVCTPASPGDHSVRGLRGGKESFAALHVTGTGTLASITISPSTATVVAGTSQNYTATGFDQFGNSLGDVTADTTFSISPDGSCSANSCSSTVAGAHTVTGTDGSFTDDATLTVDPAALDHIIVTPQDSTITFGQSQTFASTGYDVYGNSRGDLTSGTTFSITPDGSCTANVCTPASPGDHSVRGLRGGKESFAALHVTGTGTLASITISPSTATVVAGTSQNYTATGFDQFGNSLGDVTADTTFSISPDGSCSANSCSSTVAGAHTVTGTDGSFTDDATLTVNAAGLNHIIVTPQDSTIATGDSQTYSVEGFDIYGNSRGDLTSTTTFTITPDGSCTANVCTASVPGLHSVKAQKGAATDTAVLHVGGATPVITSFSPTTGKVGGSVVITGNGFTGATDVQFNGVPAPFAIDSDTQISATVPNGALMGKITVVAPGGTVVSVATFKVQPNITGFSPASGPVGTTVVITGTAFTGATVVSFNAIPATFTVDSYSQITATVPCCGASGKIKVTTPGGNGSSSTNFKVPASISSFTPGSGPVGTTVVITGVAFTGTTVVAFNGIVATTFNVDSDTQITVVVPAGATTGKIKVTTGGGSVSSSTTFTVTP